MIFDTHMHTEFSFDSREKIERLLEASEKKNLGIITGIAPESPYRACPASAVG